MVRPSRSAAIQSALGTRTAGSGAVPGEDDVRVLVDARQIGNLAIAGGELHTSFSLSCLTMSVTQPSPKDSQAIAVTGRARAATTAPSPRRRCRRPARCRSGSRPEPRSTSRVRSMASFSLALPILARCERPSAASLSFWGSRRGAWHRGRRRNAAHGPRSGLRCSHRLPIPDSCLPVGEGFPPPWIGKVWDFVKEHRPPDITKLGCGAGVTAIVPARAGRPSPRGEG